MRHIMGIDLGTSGVKVLIMSSNGIVKATSFRNYPIDIPEYGFVEQSPELWWKACTQAINECIKKSNLRVDQIESVGLSGQMHGTVIIDTNYQVIRPAIIHTDQRSTKQANYIKDKLGDEYIRKVLLNPIFPGFQIVSLCWIREMEPHNYDRLYKVLLPKDYIRLKLTGEVATDFTDASGTLAFDIINRKWSLETIGKLDFSKDIFPKCIASSEFAGKVSKDASQVTGLAEGTMVVAGGADQVMQSIGNAVIMPGSATITIGTSGQLFLPTELPVLNSELNTHTFCGVSQDSWYTMGAILNAGVCWNWFRNEVLSNSEMTFVDIDNGIRQIQEQNGNVIFLPYLSGERTPHMNPNASGMLFGLRLNTNYWHILKAIMEGITFALKQSLETCIGLGLDPGTIIASGGGARSSVWMQMMADSLNREIYTTNIKEHACVGAAIVAGVGCGIYTSLEEGCNIVVKLAEEPVIPIPKNTEIYSEYYQLYKELYDTNAFLFRKASRIHSRVIM